MRKFENFEVERLKKFISDQPTTELMHTVELANTRYTNSSNVLSNWVRFHKTGVSCTLNFAVDDYLEQIKGKKSIFAKSNS